MNKLKIFWTHPMLMDYRVPLFDLMTQDYDIQFFFHKKNSLIENNYQHINSKNQKVNNWVALKDVFIFIREIKKSDIFMTSFMTSHYSILGILIAKLFNKKVISWEEMHGNTLRFRAVLKQKFSIVLARFIDAFYVLGVTQKDYLNTIHVKSDKIFVSNEYPGNIYWDTHPNIKNLADRNIILNIGRMVEFKGLPYLLNAFKLIENEYPNLYLHLVGDGEEKAALMAESKRLAIKNIVFVDFVSDIKEKQHLYNTAKMVIVPSIICISGREGGPLVVLEALSAGTPVIASDGTGSSMRFIKDGQNGYLTEQRNINDLAEKIRMLINDIDHKQITKESVKNLFDEIPNHTHQYETLKTAINYAMQAS